MHISLVNKAVAMAALAALAPVGVSAHLTVATGSGATAAAVYTAASGDKAVFGGAVVFDGGCSAFEVKYTLLAGDDCNSCTSDTLTNTTVVTRQYPAGTTSVEAPSGFITKVEVSTGSISATGAFTASNTTADVKVAFLSERAGLCSEVLVP